MAQSENPNITASRASNSFNSLTFPLNEPIDNGVRLRFVKYDRFSNDITGGETTTSVIWLPMPVSAPDNSSIRTSSNFDMGKWGMVSADRLDAATTALGGGSIVDSIRAGVDSLLEGIYTDVVYIPGEMLNSVALSKALGDFQTPAQIFAGIVNNPHTTLLFEGVNLKSFFLEWRLSPRSLDESNALNNIINTIKYRSHPEEKYESFALNYPDLVYVEFTGAVAEYLPKFQRAFINNIVATPDSGGGIALYKSGAPTSYSLQLSFTELSIVTRETLDRQGKGPGA